METPKISELAQKYFTLPTYLREVLSILKDYELNKSKINYIPRAKAIKLIQKEYVTKRGDGMSQGTPQKYLWRLTNPQSEYYSPEFIEEIDVDGKLHIKDSNIPSIIFVDKRLLNLLIYLGIVFGFSSIFFFILNMFAGIFAFGVSLFLIFFYRFLRKMITSKV